MTTSFVEKCASFENQTIAIQSFDIAARERKLRTKWTLDPSTPKSPPSCDWKTYQVSSGGTLIITKKPYLSPIPYHYRWEGIEREIYTIGGFYSEESVMKHIKEYFHMVEGVELHERQDSIKTENHNS